MISLDDFTDMQRKLEALKQRRDETRGALAAAYERLKRDYKCGTLKEAIKLLRKREQEEQDLAAEYADARAVFDKKWKDIIDKELKPQAKRTDDDWASDDGR